MVARRICLVEDDVALADLLSDFLGRHDLDLVTIGDGLTAVEQVRRDPPDLLLLDLMLPGIDGLEVCRRLRPSFRGPILMLTARVDDVDEIIGLEVGADDYVKKPVEPRVLLARIRAALRRTTMPPTDPPAVLRFGAVEVDPGRHEARVGGRDVQLTTAEFELLWLMVSRPGEQIARDELHRELRGIAYDGIDRSIDLRVSRLRRKLGEEGCRLRSIRSVGYLWAVDR